MSKNKINKINKDYLLLLINVNNEIVIDSLKIKKNFKNEKIKLNELCKNHHDNIEDIIEFINIDLGSKLTRNSFSYCKKLDKPFQTVRVDIKMSIREIQWERKSIYANQEKSVKNNIPFDVEGKFLNLKAKILRKYTFWFKVFDIALSYEKAKKTPNMLVFSHRRSGWSNPIHKLTDNLSVEIKTNFGYGSASYFYALLTFKNILITPLSEWIDYRFAHFSSIIRYTKSFKVKVFDEDQISLFKTILKNKFWYNALIFTKNAANLSLTNEQQFVEHYVINECEAMVCGLEYVYDNNEFYFIDSNEDTFVDEKIIRKRIDFNGYELIDFKTEKIIGALEFIDKIIEYNAIIPTQKYISRIISLNKKFIPNVYLAVEYQKAELDKVNEELIIFLKDQNQFRVEIEFFNNEKRRLKRDFQSLYSNEFSSFKQIYHNTFLQYDKYDHKINMHIKNISKLNNFIELYNQHVK